MDKTRGKVNSYQRLALTLIEKDIMRHEKYIKSLQTTKKQILKEAGVK